MTICQKTHPKPKTRRTCNECHAAYMRTWRKSHPLSKEQRAKMVTRSYTHVLIKRNQIEREPCKNCGSEKSEVNHKLYPNPWFIEWLCRPCHLKLHRLNHSKPPFPATAAGPYPPLAVLAL